MLSTIDGLPQSESTTSLLHGSKQGAYQVRRSSQHGNVSLRESFEVAKKTKPSFKMHRQQSLEKLGQELGLRNSVKRLKNKLSSPESRIRQQYAPLSGRGGGQEISPLGCHQSLASITLQDDASLFFMTEPNLGDQTTIDASKNNPCFISIQNQQISPRMERKSPVRKISLRNQESSLNLPSIRNCLPRDSSKSSLKQPSSFLVNFSELAG